MATYKGVKGFTIQTIAGDPPAPIEGQVWYNTTSNVLKGYAPITGAWAAGGNVNVARRSFASCGTQTAALMACGNAAPSPATKTETYNGSTWTEAPSTNTGNYYTAGSGTTTAALKIAGSSPAGAGGSDDDGTVEVEEFNGSAWTEIAELASDRWAMGSAQQGTTTASLIFGGTAVAGASPVLAISEAYNGTSWSEVSDLNTARYGSPGAGTSTAALFISGNTGPTKVANVESYNGTSWSETGDVSTTRQNAAASGSTTAALVFGGVDTLATTEEFNGSTWTAVASLATGRQGLGGAGTSPVGLAMAGYTTANLQTTEEWSGAPVTVKTVTVS